VLTVGDGARAPVNCGLRNVFAVQAVAINASTSLFTSRL